MGVEKGNIVHAGCSKVNKVTSIGHKTSGGLNKGFASKTIEGSVLNENEGCVSKSQHETDEHETEVGEESDNNSEQHEEPVTGYVTQQGDATNPKITNLNED
ncbi:conserved hypothetical protein [Ricinus communis]|uniref:Uncharacterized protein n=1 Tax=Ricinus communis TaxID=3988 RepID=B9RLD1_RICCO|nr:conserved hypothetical protein [Ricinus communis]